MSDAVLLEAAELWRWLEFHRAESRMLVDRADIAELNRWHVDAFTGEIYHESTQFFSVIGVRVRNADNREATSWCQPMIDQKTMGILGLLVQRFPDGVDRYLLQAKAEPGNVGGVLLSPSLQSTVSNLNRAHGGSKSLFADLFEATPAGFTVEYDRHQPEDGGRFYLKTNRNMIVRVPPFFEHPIPGNFRWASLAAIKRLLQEENLVNVSVRSIISAIP